MVSMKAIDWEKTPYLYIEYTYQEEEPDEVDITVQEKAVINCHPAIFFLKEEEKKYEWDRYDYHLILVMPFSKDDYQKYLSEKSVIERRL